VDNGPEPPPGSSRHTQTRKDMDEIIYGRFCAVAKRQLSRKEMLALKLPR
jgi:hypothetical protein